KAAAGADFRNDQMVQATIPLNRVSSMILDVFFIYTIGTKFLNLDPPRLANGFQDPGCEWLPGSPPAISGQHVLNGLRFSFWKNRRSAYLLLHRYSILPDAGDNSHW